MRPRRLAAGSWMGGSPMIAKRKARLGALFTAVSLGTSGPSWAGDPPVYNPNWSPAAFPAADDRPGSGGPVPMAPSTLARSKRDPATGRAGVPSAQEVAPGGLPAGQ